MGEPRVFKRDFLAASDVCEMKTFQQWVSETWTKEQSMEVGQYEDLQTGWSAALEAVIEAKIEGSDDLFEEVLEGSIYLPAEKLKKYQEEKTAILRKSLDKVSKV